MTNNDNKARKKVQSVIKGWLETIENHQIWTALSEDQKKLIRRGVIRASWASYKIGLFTQLEDEQSESAG